MEEKIRGRMTVQEIIRKYGIWQSYRFPDEGGIVYEPKIYVDATIAKRDGMLDEIIARKPEILDYLAEQRAEAERKKKEREEAISKIEGLAEIKAAIEDLRNWEYEFEKSFEDVGGLGVRPRPSVDIKALRAKYPRADAYLKAEERANGANYESVEIEKKALEEVIFGDWEKAMKQMDEDVEAFVLRHIWD